MNDREENVVRWKNTYTSLKRQFTIIDRMIAEAKACSVKLKDPEDRTEAKLAKRLVDPIERKLGLIQKYIDKLYEILPEAAAPSEDVNLLNKTLEDFEDKLTAGQNELQGFKDEIEEWESIHVREAQPEGRTLAAGGEAPAGGGARRPPEIKGVANALKPVELTVSIQAHEMTAWREQWVEYRDNSAFSNHGERSILAFFETVCFKRDPHRGELQRE